MRLQRKLVQELVPDTRSDFDTVECIAEIGLIALAGNVQLDESGSLGIEFYDSRTAYFTTSAPSITARNPPRPTTG
jgi:hypothetical protein